METNTQITSEEFLELFRKSKLNIENQEINSILQSFINEYNHKLDKSWQTVGKLLKEFFKENNVILLGRNNMDTLFWKTRGWDNPKQKVSEEEWNNWRHYWSKKTANECRELDKVKIKIAEERGYKVIEVFESTKTNSLELI